MWADMVVFDRNTIADQATYLEPRRHASGICYVFVNGRMAVDHNQVVSTDSGQFI